MSLWIRSISGFATIQDLGWPAQRSIGLPPSGAIDATALRIANALAGNPPGAAAIELTLGPIEVEAAEPVMVAVSGAVDVWTVGAYDGPPLTTMRLEPGVVARLSPSPAGRFCYLAVSGGIAVPQLLGSRSTYLPTSLGGWHGRALRRDDCLPLGSGSATPTAGTTAATPATDIAGTPIRITGAGHTDLFDDRAADLLTSGPYRILPQSDRMGSRLAGPTIRPLVEATLPSEGTCVGAIQVPSDGNPIVLLNDGPTVGGYPKIGTVIGADLGRFAQHPLGSWVRFAWTSGSAAERATREATAAIDQMLRAMAPQDSIVP